jgi:peroxiredoxin
MMTRQTRLTHALRAALLVTALIVGSAGLASAQTTAELGKPAPAFELKDTSGKTVKLADYRGKTVVLEWFNSGCPFVKYAHGEGPLKDQAKRPGAARADVVWLAINSSASGKQGHGVEVNKQAAAEWKMTHPLLIDESGAVGRMYGAKTTPHMYVIDASGKLVYRGALDNAPMGRSSDAQPVSYVQAALDDLAAGRAVRTAETQSYGCSVKY